MDCSRFEELLSDYIDGMLAPPLSSQFGAHALCCRPCRQALDDVKSAVAVCRADEDIELPEWLASSLEMIPVEHQPLDCFSFEEIITEFLDGFVPAPVYHRFEEHATSCDKCSTLLTDVVYAVAACHSVHTYEDYEAPDALVEKLSSVMPTRRRSVARVFADRVTAGFNLILPRTTQGAAWSFATVSLLIFTTFAALLLGFSDDGTMGGVYRQAHVKAAELYSEGAGLYSQRQEVVAEIQQVGSDIGELWDTLGGHQQKTENKSDGQPQKDTTPQADSTSK
jgi:anti-sigma factor RsiW